MLELLVIELLVVCVWIGFVAYGAWFFTSATKREREQAKVQEGFSDSNNSFGQRIIKGVYAPKRGGKSIPEPPKKPPRARKWNVMASEMEFVLLVGLTTVVIALFLLSIVLIRSKSSVGSVFAEAQNITAPLECPYYLGYLKSVQKDNSAPDECFSCSMLIECLERNGKARKRNRR